MLAYRKSPLIGIGIAILAVAIVFALRILGMSVLSDESPFLLFFSALALASWCGGFVPGILATLLGSICVAFLFLPPISSTGKIEFAHLLHHFVFISTGVLISWLMKGLHGAIERSNRTEAFLENRVQERTAELALTNSELQRLSSEILTAQENERIRIARELHDELGQALTLIKLKIGLINMKLVETQQPLKSLCEDASSHVDQAIENMRRLSRDLCPATIEALGITIALQRLAEDFNNASGIQIHADIDAIDTLPLQSGILLYRIFQEGLNNIVKHSEAKAANISLKKNNGSLFIEIEDDGKGLEFDGQKSTKSAFSKGFGLTIMRERARTLGGSLEVRSGEKVGTRLFFAIPATMGDKIE